MLVWLVLKVDGGRLQCQCGGSFDGLKLYNPIPYKDPEDGKRKLIQSANLDPNQARLEKASQVPWTWYGGSDQFPRPR